MHSQLVAGVFFSLAICVAVAAALVIVVQVSRRRNVEFLLLAAAGSIAVLGAVGLGVAYLYAAGPPGLWALGARTARAASLPTIGLILIFAMRFSAPAPDRQLVVAIGAAALAAAALIAWSPVDGAAIRVDQLRVVGLSITQAWAPLPKTAAGLLLLGPIAQVAVCVLFGRAYMKGRREALALFVGSSVLALAVFNDAAVELGYMRTVHMTPLGFVGFVLSVSLFFVSQYEATRGELSRRMQELHERTVELSQSRTQLQAIQTELGRKEQLAVIGEMAAVIAHEVRNPLAVISNAVASLRREGLCRHDHEVLLGILDEEAARLNRLVTDLLAYARPVSVQRQRVVLHDLVQRAALLVGSRAGTRFDFDDTSSKGQIWADGNLLRQVFDNIVENAVQAMGGSGTVTVGVRPDCRDGTDGFAVYVTDEGEGMDTIVRSRAKDPFFTTRPSGTGLGLAIVSRIVEAHGGKLAFDSRAGEGTTVTVFLPIGSESVPPPEDRVSSHPLGSLPQPHA